MNKIINSTLIFVVVEKIMLGIAPLIRSSNQQGHAQCENEHHSFLYREINRPMNH